MRNEEINKYFSLIKYKGTDEEFKQNLTNMLKISESIFLCE